MSALLRMRLPVFLLSSLAAASMELESKIEQDDLPIVQLRVAPPKIPYPEVSAETQKLDLERDRAEMGLQTALIKAYDDTLANAKVLITKMVAEALRSQGNHKPETINQSEKSGARKISFLQRRTQAFRDGFAVKVRLVAPETPDQSIQASIDAIETKRSKLEEQLYKQACAEMSALTSLVLDELGRSLASQHTQYSAIAPNMVATGPNLSFLQKTDSQTGQSHGLPQQANIRIAASDVAFPRIADLIQEMESRRDRAENKGRLRIMELELSLLKAENNMVKEALLSTVRR